MTEMAYSDASKKSGVEQGWSDHSIHKASKHREVEAPKCPYSPMNEV